METGYYRRAFPRAENGWKSPAMLEEEKRRRTSATPQDMEMRQPVFPDSTPGANMENDWRFGQTPPFRKLVQRLQSGETLEASAKAKKIPSTQKTGNPDKNICKGFSASEIDRISKTRSYSKMSAELLRIVDRYRDLKAIYKNPPAAAIKKLLAGAFSKLPKEMITATWRFASDANSKPNMSMLTNDYETWRISSGKEHAYCAFDHIPWEQFDAYYKKHSNLNRETNLRNWINQRPDIWAYTTLRRGDWSKEDIDLLKEIIDFSVGAAL